MKLDIMSIEEETELMNSMKINTNNCISNNALNHDRPHL